MSTSRPLFSVKTAAVVFLIWIAVTALRVFLQQETWANTTGSTDDTMRLHAVRDLLQGNGWFAGLHDARLAPPEGLDSHWSRLVDVPIALLILIARPFVSGYGAETLAMIAWPALLFLAMMWGFIATGRKLAPDAGVTPMIAGALGCLNLTFLFQPTALDHHNVQVVTALWFFACALWMSEKRSAAIGGGVLAATMIAVGMESLHIYAVLNVLVVVRAFLDPARYREPVLLFLGVQVLALISFWLATVPPQLWWQPMCDAIAINVVVLCVGACGVAAAVIAYGSAWKLPTKCGVAILGLACIFGFSLALEPQCLRGPNAMVDTKAIEVWMNKVSEAKGLAEGFATAPFIAATHLIYPLLAVLCLLALVLARKMSDAKWALVACVTLATLVTVVQVRGTSFAVLFGALFLTTSVAVFTRQTTTSTLVGLLVPGILPGAMLIALLGNTPVTVADPLRYYAGHCAPRSGFPNLASEAPGYILANINMGPALLLHTQHKVMLAPYHRTSKAIADGFDLLAMPIDRARRKLQEAGFTHLADCLIENGYVQAPSLRADKTPVLQDVMRGDMSVPWAEELPLDPANPGILVWRLKF